MKKQVFLVSVVAILCITVWTFLFSSIIQNETEKTATNRNKKKTEEIEVNEETGKTEDTEGTGETEEAEEKSTDDVKYGVANGGNQLENTQRLLNTSIESDDNVVAIDYSIRGIRPGDFDSLAEDKIISLDILLEEIALK